MTRTIQAPGIELREVDKSQYSKQDYSLVGTTSLVCGVASKGDNYNINWINTTQNFLDTYGAPETEQEKWFYNAANEVLTKGGILLAARLPYNNLANNPPKYAYADYKIDASHSLSADNELSRLAALDPATIKTCIRVSSSNKTGYMTIDQLDSLKVGSRGNALLSSNSMRIVDLTRSQYDKAIVLSSDGTQQTQHAVECVGIMPVITTAANALYYQGIISSETLLQKIDDNEYEEQTGHKDISGNFVADLSCYSPVAGFKSILSTAAHSFLDESYAVKTDSKSINDSTVAKLATELFPTISYSDVGTVDKSWLKKIGLVVFQVLVDSSAHDKISFAPIESYIGSLDPDSKDELTHQSDFIDYIVNHSSSTVNIFTNFLDAKRKLDNTDILACTRQIPTAMGLYASMCEKHIDAKFTVLDALNIIFDRAKDTNTYNIDLVVDAGVSNMAQLAVLGISDPNDWKKISPEETKIWRSVQQKITTFCSSTRRDCMFIADGIRPFCLEGSLKYIRPSAPQNTVESTIIPKIKLLSGLNSSYTAGYCNWFKGYDVYSGDLIWLPPSIKMVGVYIYTDAYYNKWDAPAGMNRGRISNVVDCAFSPSQKEAEKIYLQGWNYAVSYPIDGIIAEGQKTQQIRPTAFDRVNVRRLFLHLEKEVARIAKYFLYEGNNEYQRNRFVDQIKPIFEDAVNHNGILEYYIKCDSENNTPHTIDNNELHCAIAVKPVKSIEYIVLTFVCTNQSTVVSESLAEI